LAVVTRSRLGKRAEPFTCPSPKLRTLSVKTVMARLLRRRDQTILLFSLTEGKDEPRVFIDGLRMSPGNENYKLPPPHELAVQLFACLDEQLKSLLLLLSRRKYKV
jgi:hypothetical protein